MASFIVTKKTFELSSGTSARMLVGTQHLDLDDTISSNCQVLKKHFDYTVDVAFDANGGSVSPSSKTYVVGKAYGDLPIPTKANSRFDGWWTKPYESEIEYLKQPASPVAYIDTGIAGYEDGVWEIDVRCPTTGTNRFIGCGNNAGGDALVAVACPNSGYSHYPYIYGTTWNDTGLTTVDTRLRHLVRYEFSLSSQKLYVDGVLHKQSAYSSYSATSKTIWIFANSASNYTQFFRGNVEIYSVRLFRAGSLIFDGVPVRVGQVGYLYDKVSGQLFGNQGTGSFTLGNDVLEPSASQITEQSIVDLQLTQLYAHWTEVNFSNDTEFDVVTTSSYKKTGIYSATRYSSLSSVFVDWGDGTMDEVAGNISQLAHEYSSIGTFRVRVTDNITNFAPSINNTTWYNTTSQNRYTFKNMVRTGSQCTSMPAQAFYYCQALSSINFLSSCWTSLTSLPTYAFGYCTSLTQLSSLPVRITTLGQYCFSNCTGLTGIQDLRSTGLTSLYNAYTFYYCSNVREWKLPSSLTGTYFGSNLFRSNTLLSAIELPSSLTSIATGCFRDNTSLKSIIVPSKVTNIGNYAFYSCTQLSSVTYETTALTSIGARAFYNNYSLHDLNVPQTVKSIGSYAYYNCYSTYASALALPSALTAVGTYAYQNCYNLKTLSVPSGLTSIGDYAFAGCRALSSIVDTRLTAQTVGANTFGSATGTGTTAYAGYSTRGSNVLSIYWAATGYDSSYWLDPLQNADKCGYSIQYLDPENVQWCEVSFDCRGCGAIEGARYATASAAQGKKFASLPTPTATTDGIVFGGWYTGIDGTGTLYEAGSTCPTSSSLQLYARWLWDGTVSYDTNDGEWTISQTQTNPDSSQFYGVFQSESNYHVDNYCAKMYVYTSGVTRLTLYIRSYAEGECDFVIAMQPDHDISEIFTQGQTSPSWDELWDNQYVAGSTVDGSSSGQDLSAYTPVTYVLDGGSHSICIAYGKDGSVSSNDDRGYLLVPVTGSTYSTRNMVDANGSALAIEGKTRVIVLEQY